MPLDLARRTERFLYWVLLRVPAHFLVSGWKHLVVDWPAQTQEGLNLLKFKNKPKLFGTFQKIHVLSEGKGIYSLLLYMKATHRGHTVSSNFMEGTHPLIRS